MLTKKVYIHIEITLTNIMLQFKSHGSNKIMKIVIINFKQFGIQHLKITPHQRDPKTKNYPKIYCQQLVMS